MAPAPPGAAAVTFLRGADLMPPLDSNEVSCLNTGGGVELDLEVIRGY